MQKLVVALGSESKLKISAVREAFRRLGIDAEVQPYKVASGVSEQPEGLDVMIAGATHRAADAYSASMSADIGIGLENGIVSGKNVHSSNDPVVFFDQVVAAVYTFDSVHAQCFFGLGPGFPVPSWAVEEARVSELGEVVMKRGASDKNPAAYFSEGEIDREETLVWAVICALMPYRHLDRYRQH